MRRERTFFKIYSYFIMLRPRKITASATFFFTCLALVTALDDDFGAKFLAHGLFDQKRMFWQDHVNRNP